MFSVPTAGDTIYAWRGRRREKEKKEKEKKNIPFFFIKKRECFFRINLNKKNVFANIFFFFLLLTKKDFTLLKTIRRSSIKKKIKQAEKVN